MKKVVMFILMCLFVTLQTDAQGWLEKIGNTVKKTVVEKAENSLKEKSDEATDNALNNAEDSVKKKAKGEKTSEAIDDNISNNSGKNSQKLISTSRYDFVPGDAILYFEDFSQDAIGDFPALWTTNGSGEIKTVNIVQGKWFHLNGQDAVYCYTKEIPFPDNFIVEFDIIPDEEYQHGITLTVYQEKIDDPKELNDDLFPGVSGLHVVPKYDGWETKGYKEGQDWISGNSSENPVVKEKFNHVIVWIQKRRVRIYHEGKKVVDMPTNIYPDTRFNRLRFSGWDANSNPYITNLKITTASPDTRSKLINEGKLVTYGITFDVNKADIKSESYGTLKGIADVLQENASVKVKIIGHTDSDGDNGFNLDLSKRRAESVKGELARNFGIDASRMETEGAGETKPIAKNDMPVNKAQNRRVEFIKL